MSWVGQELPVVTYKRTPLSLSRADPSFSIMLRVTGRQKHSEERATLFPVPVGAIVRFFSSLQFLRLYAVTIFVFFAASARTFFVTTDPRANIAF